MQGWNEHENVARDHEQVRDNAYDQVEDEHQSECAPPFILYQLERSGNGFKKAQFFIATNNENQWGAENNVDQSTEKENDSKHYKHLRDSA